MTTYFKGFKKEFWNFFEELKENNDREWFAENKERYKSDVVTPCMDFIVDMGERLKDISPHYVAIPKSNGGSMFRIYRDVRFSKDKRPYKENAGIQFRHKLGKNAHAPGFYVHLEKGNLFYGGGIWSPENEILAKIRDRIVEHPKKWQSIIENEEFLSTFENVRGDGLKRPPRGYDPDNKFIEDLKRKSFFAMHNVKSHAMVGKPAFIDDVVEKFEAASPLVAFLCDATGAEF